MSDKSDGSMDTLKPVLVSTDSPRKPVKSTAIVKYSAVQSPATFAQLQCNTNLNHPPSNWLSSSAESYGLQSVWSQNTGFTSFRMAHMFPDCVGEVDVVSDAENIKKLLKMPYSHGVISMMVHRIENTLLLDDFDIQKYLLRQAESDWEWLREFFYQHIIHDGNNKDKRLFHKTNSRNTLQQKNLVSKFLYHSLVLADNNQQKTEKPPLPLKTFEPLLPEPTNEEQLPDPNHNHKFARNVAWTFENIQMLIGTDMPIFGGKTHPCISLRLRDVNKPINVLTGIDYWLDNLMCNVPEVVMCYHLDGIVQKYELIKTEDLPNLDDAKFSPKVIRDVAQNILSFLKSNATKAGHTYWLFKGRDDDFVKLYDLTSLCSDMFDVKGQNPFTVPVAMLLYRVARNMKYSSDNRGHQGTIRMLLKNCIQLLNREKYPQIVTSAQYMLSDLYVPADTDPASPILVDQNEEEDSQSECGSNHQESEESVENDGEAFATIKSLTLAHIRDESETENLKYKPPPISGSIAERCIQALQHVADGLDCLKYFPISDAETVDERKKSETSTSYENENLRTAKPFEAIPMPYVPLNAVKKDQEIDENSGSSSSSPSHKKKLKKKLKKEKLTKDTMNTAIVDNSPRALLCKTKVDTLPTWQAPRKTDNSSWKSHLKTLLYEKASLIYSVLAEYEYTNQRYGASLRCILAVLKCQKILEVFCCLRNDKLISCLLGRAGDSCLMTVQDWRNIQQHRHDYKVKDEIEEKLVGDIFNMQDMNMNEAEILSEAFDSLEATLVASYKCYEKALALGPLGDDKNNLLRRLGNIHNELGVLYMNQAASKYQQNDSEESSDVTLLLTRSLTHLEAGVKAFDTVRDEANLALLYSNTGRLMRLCAHMHVKKQTQERHFYKKAIVNYQKALQVLGCRKSNPSIWDTVTWDLSTTLYTMATLLQDYPTVGAQTEEELEREVVELLQKALKHCDVDTPSPRQPVYQFRAATIQHRLGSLYHRVYRELESDTECMRRKTSLQLSKLYYDKAAKLFLTLEQPVEYLTVQLERVALAEHQALISTTFNGKLKSYQNAMELILQCQPILDVLVEKLSTTKTMEKKKSDGKENEIVDSIEPRDEQLSDDDQQNENEEKLILLLQQRIQFILKSLTKLFLSKNNKKEFENLANVYKMCYSRSLKLQATSGLDLIKEIRCLIQEISPKLCEVQEIY